MRVAIVKKKPAEKFAVGFKYSTADIQADATIDNVTVSITRADGEAITSQDLSIVGSPQVDDRTVGALIEKGINNLEYYVAFTVTTSANQIFKDKVFVKVRD